MDEAGHAQERRRAHDLGRLMRRDAHQQVDLVRAAIGGNDLARLGPELLEREQRVVVDAARGEHVGDRVAERSGATGIGVCSGVKRWISTLRRMPFLRMNDSARNAAS